jgi:hypothetical protein
MSNAVVGYRVKLVVTSLCVGAGVALGSQVLPAKIQPFAGGVAGGLLFMLQCIVLGWAVKETAPVDPVEVRRNIAPLSKRMKLATALAPPVAFGLCLVVNFGLPSDVKDVLGGIAVGILLMFAIMLGPALWAPAKPNPQKRRIAPLEESSPHTLVVPSATNQHADRRGSGEVS